MFDDPTVAQVSSITQLRVQHVLWYSWITTPASRRSDIALPAKLQQNILASPAGSASHHAARVASVNARRKVMPGKNRVAMTISRWRGGLPPGRPARCRGGGAGCRESRTSPSAFRRARSVRVGKQGSWLVPAHELHQRPHPLHGLRDPRQQRPFHATAKSAAAASGPACYVVETLMPPTNAMRRSTWTSLPCRRRNRWERNCHGATSGRYLSSSMPASRMKRSSAGVR